MRQHKTRYLNLSDNATPLQKLRSKFRVLQTDCGEICELRPEKQNVVGKAFYNVLKKEFDCCKLIGSPASS